MRNRRILIFGLVFLMMGILFLIGTSLEFDHRATSVAKYAQTHPEEWHLLTEPSTFEEGAGLTGIISVGVGFAFLIVTAIQSLRRQTL